MSAPMSDKAVIDCPEGTVLFREGESSDNVYVIKSGRVRLRKRVHETELVVDEIGAGAFCGELTLINDQPRPVTASVVSDASVIKIKADQFESMVRNNPDIAIRMIKKMGERLTRAQYRLSNLVLRTTTGRLLRQLRHEAKRAGNTDAMQTPTPLPDDLAGSLAMEVGEVKEALSSLISKDLIELGDDGDFVILDPSAVERYLAYLELKDRYEYTDT
jgi:CRP-like cAMP-binding protein